MSADHSFVSLGNRDSGKSGSNSGVSADHSFVSLGNAERRRRTPSVATVSADHSFVSLGNDCRLWMATRFCLCRLIIPSSAWATWPVGRPDDYSLVSADHSFVSLGNTVARTTQEPGVRVSADHSFVSLGNMELAETGPTATRCRLIIPSSAWATLSLAQIQQFYEVSADHSFVSLGNRVDHCAWSPSVGVG